MIVVGVDGSEASLQALRWAIDEARLRQCPLRAVYAWQQPLNAAYGYVPPDALDRGRLQVDARKALEDCVARVAAERGDVGIELAAVEGRPGQALVEAAADADLLVVGSRGHGGFAGLLLGSVSQQCAHHARCPVAIVRGARRHEEAS